MDRIKRLFIFIFSNFGPLVGFYLTNQIWGLKAAVLASVILVLAEFFWLKSKKEKVSSFFYFSSTLVIVFGMLDLSIQEPFFIKFEATLTNLFFAVFFGISLFKEKSIVQEFAETQKRTSTEQSQDKKFFFQLFTIFWCLYFLVKAVFYLWLNFNSSLNEGLLLRLVIGKISFWIMMFISIGLPRYIWNLLEKMKLFPSQKTNRALV